MYFFIIFKLFFLYKAEYNSAAHPQKDTVYRKMRIRKYVKQTCEITSNFEKCIITTAIASIIE